jgi:two-component system chemotaxis sensor kinase CheA
LSGIRPNPDTAARLPRSVKSILAAMADFASAEPLGIKGREGRAVCAAAAVTTNPETGTLRGPEAPLAAGRGRGLSIYQKLLALILTLVAGVIVVLAVYLPSRQIAEFERALEAKADTYAILISKQLEPAIAFNDQATAREVFDSVAQDPDVASLALFTSENTLLYARGTPSPDILARRAGSAGAIATPERLAAIKPVVSLEGPRGTLAIELSTKRVAERRGQVQRDALLAGLGALVLGALGAFWIARSLGQRLASIASVAQGVAAGNLDQPPIRETGKDEIGTVVVAFNAMLSQIRALIGQIQESARREQGRLEQLVEERTRELDARNADMRRILEKIGQGFFTMQRDGSMSTERSAVLEQWFGEAPESGLFSEYLARVDPRTAEWFVLGWESVTDGILPVEVALAQLPKLLVAGDRHYELSYRAIHDSSGGLERVLVVISDVTAQLERARAEADEREVTNLFTRLLSDRRGFIDFITTTHSLVNEIAHTRGGVAFKRALHTLKGNASIYGIGSVASICHELETELADRGELSPTSIDRLTERWKLLSTKVHVLSNASAAKIELDDADYEEVLSAVEQDVARDEIRDLLLGWKLELVETRLARLAEHAEALGRRLGRAPLAARIDAERLRLEPERWNDFWSSVVHVLRNSVDHGIESSEERRALGKPLLAKLDLRAHMNDRRFTIEVSDDGRGVDWELVKSRASALGLSANTRAELVECLFTDGLSTRSEATELSGRGVGLGAVRAACTKLGGHVEIESFPGVGTTIRFVWPASVLSPSLPASARWARSGETSEIRRLAAPE